MVTERGRYKIGKPKSSCTQCRKRKQRCNRIWPCNHCTKRAIGHLCQYDQILQQKTKSSSLDENREPNGREDVSLFNQTTPDSEACKISPPSVDVWGYRDGLAHFNLDDIEVSNSASTESPNANFMLHEVLIEALKNVPNRTLTDALVRSYLQNGNLQYYSVHPQTFLHQYEAWWTTRQHGEDVSLPFTSLLLQMCANAAQGCGDELARSLQYELCETTEQASVRLCEAAETLGKAVAAGTGGLHRVMQLLLAAAWRKTEGRIVEGWHSLSIAVHEAQECGLGTETTLRPSISIDIEIRRRTWAFIVVWDWQMAEWLSRPMLTTVLPTTPAPDPSVDVCEPGQPSPISNLCEQFKLVRSLSTRYGRLSEIIDPVEVQEAVDLVEMWMAELPAELKVEGADQSHDEAYPWLPFQRALLHTFAQMARLTPLKKTLVLSAPKSEVDALRDRAVASSISCVDAALKLQITMQPVKSPFHFVIFALFDTAAFIYSALLHDRESRSPQRSVLLQKAHGALGALEGMAGQSKAARGSRGILAWFLGRLEGVEGAKSHSDALTGEVNGKRPNARSETSSSKTGDLPTPQSSIHGSAILASDADQRPLQDFREGGDCGGDTLTYQDPEIENSFENAADLSWLSNGDFSFDDLVDVDIGGMESIWDWEALGIESTGL